MVNLPKGSFVPYIFIMMYAVWEIRRMYQEDYHRFSLVLHLGFSQQDLFILKLLKNIFHFHKNSMQCEWLESLSSFSMVIGLILYKWILRWNEIVIIKSHYYFDLKKKRVELSKLHCYEHWCWREKVAGPLNNIFISSTCVLSFSCK